ncbi:MAG: hypothetical protein AAB389_03265 [Patescibacteria group bacterium]
MLIKFLVGLNIGLVILSAVLFYLQIGLTDNLLVVWFDSLRGTSSIGRSSEIAAVLGIALLINAINLGLAGVFRSRNLFLTKLFLGATVFFNLLILIYISVIVSIN